MNTSDRIDNWSKWARAGRWASSRHVSSGIYRLYRPESGKIYDDPKPLLTDSLDAWEVECAWRMIPGVEKMILSAHYVTGPVVTQNGKNGAAWDYHRRKVCRKYGIRLSEWMEWVRAGEQAITRILSES